MSVTICRCGHRKRHHRRLLISVRGYRSANVCLVYTCRCPVWRPVTVVP